MLEMNIMSLRDKRTERTPRRGNPPKTKIDWRIHLIADLTWPIVLVVGGLAYLASVAIGSTGWGG
jgi:hypothetical protein